MKMKRNVTKTENKIKIQQVKLKRAFSSERSLFSHRNINCYNYPETKRIYLY